MAYGIINGGTVNGEGADGGIGTGDGDPSLMQTPTNDGFVATDFGLITAYPTPVIPETVVRLDLPPRTSRFGAFSVASALTGTQSVGVNLTSFGASSVLMAAELDAPIGSTAFGETGIFVLVESSPISSTEFGAFELMLMASINPLSSTTFGAISVPGALAGTLESGIESTEFGSAVADQTVNILPAFAGARFGRLVITRGTTC